MKQKTAYKQKRVLTTKLSRLKSKSKHKTGSERKKLKTETEQFDGKKKNIIGEHVGS